jgi:hypothetical protein
VPGLIQTCHDGLRILPNVLASLIQPDGQFGYTNGQLLDAQWCSHDLLNCVPDLGFGCPIDECTHFVWVYAGGPGVFIEARPWIPVTFSASHIDGIVHSGTWAGPTDWNLDGLINSSDFFMFLDEFFTGEADYDVSGLTDSQDLFSFLGDFEG